MEARELRIGNLFTDKYSKNIIPVLELSRNGNIVFDFECAGVWQAEAIPLTEQWLFNFGFEKGNYEEWSLYLPDDNLSCKFELKYNEIYGYRLCQEGCFVFSEIKYIHQLQNLYFALTGKELILKDKN